jgi:transcriptional regulator with XRE-family HTH domain
MLSTPNLTRPDTERMASPRNAAHEGMRRPWSPSRLQIVIDDPTRKARFAYAIRTARERRGLTPPQLAKLLDVQPSTVNAWEHPAKTAAPSILYLGLLCEALGVDANLFAVLPPIPAWEGETYLMDDPAERAARAALADEAAHESNDGGGPVEEGTPTQARE